MVNCVETIALIITFATLSLSIQGEAKAFFVFGDSLVDNGNNNFLLTTARADSPPYGIDASDHRPSGRFSNGYNFADVLGKYFGWEPILPYLSPDLQGDKLLQGANFASAGVGILNDTGIQFVNIIRIYDQIAYFETYKQRLSKQVGDDQALKIVNESLYLITLGGNDFVNNYYLVPFSLRSQQYPLGDYCTFIVSEYKKILKKLYDVGARRVIVTGTGPLGCVPAEIAQRGGNNGECASTLNEAADIFNPKLNDTILALNKELGSDVFTYANTNRMHMDFISDPNSYGFDTSKTACCGQGPFNGIGLCTALSNLCSNRDKYVFWDAFHPTERANQLFVQQMMNASTKYMTPMNLSTIKFLHFS